MTYADIDKSANDGAPIECYKIFSLFGEFFYTNNNEEIMFNGDVYEPLNISHSKIITSSALDDINTVDINIPAQSPLAILYCFLKSPDDVTVQIFRIHRSDDLSVSFKSEWIGIAIGSGVGDDIATIKTGSILQAKLNGSSGNILYQRVCNHDLYDARCKVDKNAFKILATVTKVQGTRITLNSDGTSDNTLQDGTITNDRTGEVRSITTNVNNVITVTLGFIDIEKDDTVTIYHGCNHVRLGDCKQKFNNVVNYGGMDFIPTVNPFVELSKQNQAQITEKTKVEAGNTQPIPFHWEGV